VRGALLGEGVAEVVKVVLDGVPTRPPPATKQPVLPS